MALAISSGSPTRPSGTVEMRPAFLSHCGKAIEHPRLGRPRCYCVNANARTGDLERRGLREPLDGVLAGHRPTRRGCQRGHMSRRY